MSTTTCPNCSKPVPSAWLKCLHCGKEIPKTEAQKQELAQAAQQAIQKIAIDKVS